ncbi:hypothetical protein ABZU32_24935 [Sphaerisporangium sp. NPDC005288]|uniref:hypothetical protein n=1 Tax=Sphaerisporangium sp. NPDC005288 TaxID=3155114 RepID=UPI0033A8E9F5
MAQRALIWGGAAVAVAAAAGLGVYFARVGLDAADKLASVIGVFVALAGLGVAVYGMVADRRAGVVRQQAEATGGGQVYQAGRDLTDRPAGRLWPTATGGDNADGQARPGVRQQAKATGRGSRVDQAGRDRTSDER